MPDCYGVVPDLVRLAVRYGPYEGVCYDGPHEGRRHKQEYSEFRVALYGDMPIRYAEHMTPEYLEVKTGTYRWSVPLRKWVFRQ